MKKKDLIVVRGAGDLATGTIHRLKKAGFRLLVLEAEHPAAIRRQVALSEAVYAGSARVEDVEAVRMDVDLAEKKNRKELLEQEMERIWKKDGVPVLVDPDDKTPLAIKNTGARIVSYGAPVLPGAMFLLAYAENGTPIVGLPGCVMYSKRTIFDLVLPRLIADDEVTAEELAGLGEGGLCLNCKVCTFPNCGFGKGR